ncbi:MAG TPA: glycosyltransferase family 2 protein [Patescibacteria group bacterium]|nr:glycosyltransferase family 2 protein [Patescibacteria group bacterium]
MQYALKRFFERNETRLQRPLEIFPGLFSWGLITMPFWLSFWKPSIVAYFVILFDVYWFYRSAQIALYSTQSFLRLKAHEEVDWDGLTHSLKNPPFPLSQIHHVVIIPTYKEPLHILQRTIRRLAEQTFQKNQITVVLATEKRDPNAPEVAKKLQEEFQQTFAHFFITVHPEIPGEVKGKSSNMAWAGKWVTKKLQEEGYALEHCTVTSCDADSLLPFYYYSYLTYTFLTDEERYFHFYQGALLFYNNIWRVPLPVRLINTIGSMWNLGILMRPDKLFNMSTYSLSLKLCQEVGYWAVDVIPEDWHLFFKSFFSKGPKIKVIPLFLAIYQDAAESNSFFQTMVNQYEQMKRWAWGITDDPFIMKQWFLHPEIPFLSRTTVVLRALEGHFLWPVNWFILTLGATLPPFLNPAFKETVLGRNLPLISGNILTLCLLFLLVLIIIDMKMKPKRPASFPRKMIPLLYLQWIALPFVSFFLSALPGLDAHTRLMLGKYLEYRVTEKV